MNSTGGLVYHLRALRYFSQEWRSHQRGVHDFLDHWLDQQKIPRLRALVLIGSSGGYALPKIFLESYEKIIAYEPDALARFIFKKRFGAEIASRMTWVSEPYDFESPLPEGAILFSNLLGQVTIADVSTFRSRLMKVLKGRVWASYHDAMSGHDVRFKVSRPEERGTIETRSTRPVEVIEHLAPDLFTQDPSLKHRFWEWRITRKRSHLIEGVYQA